MIVEVWSFLYGGYLTQTLKEHTEFGFGLPLLARVWGYVYGSLHLWEKRVARGSREKSRPWEWDSFSLLCVPGCVAALQCIRF